MENFNSPEWIKKQEETDLRKWCVDQAVKSGAYANSALRSTEHPDIEAVARKLYDFIQTERTVFTYHISFEMLNDSDEFKAYLRKEIEDTIASKINKALNTASELQK
jgi:hypothetical protein